MSDALSVMRERIARTNSQLLALTTDLPEASFARRHGPRAPSIRFHLFHASRWADKVQSWLPSASGHLHELFGRRPQIWEAQEIAAKWGLSGMDLGESGTGMGVPDDDAAALPLPVRDVVTSYAASAFAELEQALAQLKPEHIEIECRDFSGRENTVGGALVHHLIHSNRHLGMIEALRGVLGVRGTATQ